MLRTCKYGFYESVNESVIVWKSKIVVKVLAVAQLAYILNMG